MKQEAKSLDDQLQGWRNFWAERIRKNDELASLLATSAIRYSLISHAAVLIACLNAFLTPSASQFRGALLLVMYASLAGLVLSGVGQWLLLEGLSNFTEKIRGRLIRKDNWKGIYAPVVYGERYYGRTFKSAGGLILGSLLWLVVYIFAGLTILANS